MNKQKSEDQITRILNTLTDDELINALKMISGYPGSA